MWRWPIAFAAVSQLTVDSDIANLRRYGGSIGRKEYVVNFKLFAVGYDSGEPTLQFLKEVEMAPGLQWTAIGDGLQVEIARLREDDREFPQVAVYSNSGPLSPGCMIAIEAFDDEQGRHLVMLVNSLSNVLTDRLAAHQR
jgi:hypothetical protein